jgi:hypothetical protein
MKITAMAMCVWASACAFADPPPAPPIGSRAPSIELGEFGAAYLDRILAPLDQQVPLPRGQVAQLRESFTDRWAKAPQNEKPAYQAAVTVCNAVSQAMDEREKAINSVQSSSSVQGSYDLGAHRKDKPTWKELRREGHEENNRKEQAAQRDDFFSSQLRANWQQRAIQLRQNVDRLYSYEREAERRAQQQQAPGGAPGGSETITLNKPTQVKVKYGTATIPAGTILPVVSRDAKGIVIDYSGEKVILPP